MQIITTPCSPDANSYATLEEFDAYLSGRDGFDTSTWDALTDDKKIIRAFYGTCVIDSLSFRGIRACRNQSLQFPRLMPGSKLYESGSSFEDLESLEEFAGLLGEQLPTIPQEVKLAQIEATYQVIHSHLFNIEAFESGESSIASLSIDVIRMTFSKEPGSAYSLFSKADFGAASTIKLLLQRHLTGIRASLV